MDWLVTFPEGIDLPLARWITDFEEWLVRNFDEFFDAFRDFLLFFLIRIEDFLKWLPWTVVFVVVIALAWRARGPRLAAGTAAGMLLIGALDLWDLTMETVAVVVVAALLAVLIGSQMG